MYDHLTELRQTVEESTPKLLALSTEQSARRPAPGKWSPKEIIGHLVDSAAHNHTRFVEAQLQDDLVFPGYDQNAWVRAQDYQGASWPVLVHLWRGYNLHIAHVMSQCSESARSRLRYRHNLHQIAWQSVPEGEATTLEYFMCDYVRHLQHHLRQILPH